MRRVFRYTVIASIACIMILAVRIATQELSSAMEYTDYSLQNIAYIDSEPSFSPIDYERPSFGMETSAIDSLPTGTETDRADQPDAESAPVNSSSAGSGSGSSSSTSGTGKNAATASNGSSQASDDSGETYQTEEAQSESTKAQPANKDEPAADSRYAYYKAPAGYEPYYDGDFYLISYPKGWKKSTSSGDYAGVVFESEADSQGDKTTMTMISTVLDTDDGLSLFSREGNQIVNEVIANAGIDASIVDKGYATTGNRSAYYIIIDVPNGDKTNQISQYYIFYQEKVLLVEFTGVKGKVSKEHIDKILGSFENK